MISTSAKVLFGNLWPLAPAGLHISLVVTDSRDVKPGCVFVAIRGERVDGHDYAAGALEAGAALVVVQHPVEGVPPDRAVLVPDPLDAMIAMGANYRAGYQPLMLAVTGSIGKTTTKEFCGAVFSSFGETLKTLGNQNTEIGMPNTLFRLDDSIRYAVVEMGMQNLGEIRKLTLAAKPDGAIITRISPAHIETLGSMENILKAKMEVCEGLAFGAPLVLNGDDEMLRGAKIPEGVHAVYVGIDFAEAEVQATEIKREGGGQVFTIVDRQFGSFDAFIPALGRHNVSNALLAYTAATRLGLNAAQSAMALAGFETAEMRQRIREHAGVQFIEDCYNAGPDSMEAALSILAELEPEGSRVAVLGDMLEMGPTGPDAHRALGNVVAEAGVEYLITVGTFSALTGEEAARLGVRTAHFTKNADAAQSLVDNTKEGDAVLLKASRSMKFEEILTLYDEKRAAL